MKNLWKASAEARKQQTAFENISSEATFQKFLMEWQVYKWENLWAWLETLVEEGDISTEQFQNLVDKLEKQKENFERVSKLFKTEHKQKEKLGSKLGSVSLYEQKLDEVPENLLAIYQNQLYDLRKPEISLEKFACELTFYDFFLRIASWEPVNIHLIPYKNLQNLVKIWKEFIAFEETSGENSENEKPMRKSRDFKRILSQEQTPNDKNYEKNLIQKLTFKRMIEEIELLDWVYLTELKENLDSIEYLADQYREMIVENWLSVKVQKIELKKYQKERKKITDRNLKIRYRLAQKYGYLC